MATISTVGQKTVGLTAVQLTADTAAATTLIQRGVKFSVPTTGKCYYGFSNAVTTGNGFYINGVAEIAPADTQYVGDIWLISDTASQQVCYDIVGQPVTIS